MPSDDRIALGLGLRLFAILCLSTMSALIKLGEAHGATLVETLFFRQLCALPIVLGWLFLSPGESSVRTERLGAHAVRATIGMAGMVFNFGAVLLLPLAEAVTLSFTVPAFATLLSAVVLKEHVGRWRWGAVLVGFVGVLIMARPGAGGFPLLGLAIGLTAAVLVATVSIQLRHLGRTESAVTTVFWFTVLSLPPLAVLYAANAQAHDAATWAILIGIGLVGGASQLGLTGALRFAPVSAVVPMDYSGLLWATLYGWALFGAWPTQGTWFGAPLIMASGLVIVWREQRLARQRRSSPAAM